MYRKESGIFSLLGAYIEEEQFKKKLKTVKLNGNNYQKLNVMNRKNMAKLSKRPGHISPSKKTLRSRTNKQDMKGGM